MRTIFQVATLFEATPLIRELGLQRIKTNGGPRCYQSPDSRSFLYISGIGNASVRHSTQRLAPLLPVDCDSCQWINVGIAGCTCMQIPTGTLFQVQNLYNEPSQAPSPVISPNWNPFAPASPYPFASLVTVSRECHDWPAREPNDPILLIDMEAYVWMQELELSHCPGLQQVASFKVVSDHVDGQKINFHDFAPAFDTGVASLLRKLDF